MPKNTDAMDADPAPHSSADAHLRAQVAINSEHEHTDTVSPHDEEQEQGEDQEFLPGDPKAEFRATIASLEAMLDDFIAIDKSQLEPKVVTWTEEWLERAAALAIALEKLESALSLYPKVHSTVIRLLGDIKEESTRVVHEFKTNGVFRRARKVGEAVEDLWLLRNAIHTRITNKYNTGPRHNLNQFIEGLTQKVRIEPTESGIEAPVYKYEPLEPNQVRLLHLRGNDEDARLSGRIKVYDLPSREITSRGSPVIDAPDSDRTTSINQSTFSQSPMPEYSALSYHWGQSSMSADIFIMDDSTDGLPSRLSITFDLALTLNELRQSKAHKHLILWVDAICIDHDNNSERNAHISRREQIYSCASSLYICLGPECFQSSLAINYAKQMTDVDWLDKEFETAGTNPTPSPDELLAFYHLTQRPWFSGRWVVQEMCLARDALVFCGKEQITWKRLEEAISIFPIHASHSRWLTGWLPDLLNASGEVNPTDAMRLVKVLDQVTRRTDDGSITERNFTLEGLMSIMITFGTSSPQDIVYALLWLANDHGRLDLAVETAQRSSRISKIPRPLTTHDLKQRDVIKADYRQSTFHVYTAFLRHVFNQSKSIDIICLPWAMEPSLRTPNYASAEAREPSLPTWMLTDNCITAIDPIAGVLERVRADPLVRPPGGSSRTYSACGRWKAQKGSEPCIDDLNRTLKIRGFVLGTLVGTKVPAYTGNIPLSWLQQMGWFDENKHPFSVLKLLVANRGPGGYDLSPAQWRFVCSCVLSGQLYRNAVDIRPVHGDPRSVAEFKQRTRSVVWNRRLASLRTRRTQKELDALVPTGARDGDIVCIFAGCSVPVVLRLLSPSNPQSSDPSLSSESQASPGLAKQEEQNTGWPTYDPADRFQFVGEAYVSEAMEGEGFEHQRDNGEVAQYFTLV